MKPVKVLVIENDPAHIADAKEFFQSKPFAKVTYAKSLREAVPNMQSMNARDITLEGLKRYDLILSDIHFSLNPHCPEVSDEYQIGVGILFACSQFKIPCVLVTDKGHHNTSLEWIYQLLCGLKMDNIVDSYDGKKKWEDAWNKVLMEMVRMKFPEQAKAYGGFNPTGERFTSFIQGLEEKGIL